MAKGFIFDMNGTMIDDMAYHQQIWERILNDDLKAGLTPEQVKLQMYGKNEEVLIRIFGDKFSQQQMDEISMHKEQLYQDLYRPHLKLIDGLPELLEKAARNNILMAIATAAIPFNINFVVDTLNIRHYFKAMVSADDVQESKPHPEVFLKAAKQLNLSLSDCVVFEDSPKGVEAVQNAGMKAVVLTTLHGPEDFRQYDNVLYCIRDFRDERLEELL